MNYDHYVYPGTNVLVNKIGITDQAMLQDAERRLSEKNAYKLYSQGVSGRFDTDHVRSIHKHLFGDIYDWAGEFRDIMIWKGGTAFTDSSKIQDEMDRLSYFIQSNGFFKDAGIDGLADGISYVFSSLNMIHPFREGNGRTQRLFSEQIAFNAGYDLDFRRVTENDMRNASMASARGDMRLIRFLISDNMSRIGRGPAGPVHGSALSKLLGTLDGADHAVTGNDGYGL